MTNPKMSDLAAGDRFRTRLPGPGGDTVHTVTRAAQDDPHGHVHVDEDEGFFSCGQAEIRVERVVGPR